MDPALDALMPSIGIPWACRDQPTKSSDSLGCVCQDSFSVPRPNCGQRKIYGLAEVHNRKENAATDTFPEIEFGSKTDIRST